MLRYKVLFGTVVILILALSLCGVASAASSATINFGTGQQPDFAVHGVDVVDDGGGCDLVVVVIADATGQITDTHILCLNLVSGFGGASTSWGAYATGYIPVLAPITYTIFDIPGGYPYGENTTALGNDLLANGTCIGEAFYYPDLVTGAPFSICHHKTAAVGGGCSLTIPEGSVVGEAPSGAQVFYEPGNVAPNVILNAGTYIVVGQDKSEIYYKVVLACQFLWVRKDTVQPSFQSPQNGASLPTRIVS